MRNISEKFGREDQNPGGGGGTHPPPWASEGVASRALGQNNQLWPNKIRKHGLVSSVKLQVVRQDISPYEILNT